MVDAVGKPYPFQIDFHRLEIVRLTGYRLVTIDHLQHLSDAEIVFPKLIKRDVPSKQCGFRQVIDKHLLLQGQLVEAIQSISEQL